MQIVLKLLIFASVLVLSLWAGYFLYKKVNKLLKESQTGWQLLGYSVLLFVLLGILFTASLYFLVLMYVFLK